MLIDTDGLTREEIMSAVPSVYAESPHESRSRRYLYIPTGDILDGLREEGFIPTSVMQARAKSEGRIGYTKHLVRLRKESDLGDSRLDVHEIVLINSHDGSSSYQFMSGVFRTVCTNGLITGNIDDTLKVYHKGNILNEVIENTYRIVEESARVMDEIEEMKQIELTRPEQLLLSEFSMKARFEEEDEAMTRALVPYQPEDFLHIRHREDKGHNDLYTTYNTIQENIIEGGISRRDGEGHRHTTRAIRGIDQSVKINRLLWQFAKAMKELKNTPTSNDFNDE